MSLSSILNTLHRLGGRLAPDKGSRWYGKDWIGIGLDYFGLEWTNGPGIQDNGAKKTGTKKLGREMP